MKNTWITYKEKKYYFDKNGHALKGMKKVGKELLLFSGQIRIHDETCAVHEQQGMMYIILAVTALWSKRYSIHGRKQ